MGIGRHQQLMHFENELEACYMEGFKAALKYIREYTSMVYDRDELLRLLEDRGDDYFFDGLSLAQHAEKNTHDLITVVADLQGEPLPKGRRIIPDIPVNNDLPCFLKYGGITSIPKIVKE